MPELPEVETVKNGLNAILEGLSVEKVKVNQSQLRFKIPRNFKNKITNAGQLITVHRKAKYLVFEFEKTHMISHLGMTGHWKFKSLEYKKEKHDHVEFNLSNKTKLIYNDPRRFGWLEWVDDIEEYFKNKNHGPEPLSRSFNSSYLLKVLKPKKAPIKASIMAQEIVLGVGNIYACESLHLSRISPLKASNSINNEEASLLVKNIKKVLKAAIKAGGSTIKDFKQAGGESGYFQTQLFVYGRENELCKNCHGVIANAKLSGRSSFYCPDCQN